MKNKSHPIPKDQQIKQTPYNQQSMMYDYLEGAALNTITRRCGQMTKRDRGLHGMEGNGVERKTEKLWRGRTWFSDLGRHLLEIPKFDRLPDRTGRPLRGRETKCFLLGIENERSIEIMSRLSGRDEEEVQEIVSKLTGKNEFTLFNQQEKSK